jgi:hypothetical protein
MRKPTKSPMNKTSRLLTTAERRAWIWASERTHSAHGALYHLFPRLPTEEVPLTDADAVVEKFGVKAAFDYLTGHTNAERTEHGFWVVGSPEDDSLMIFDDMPPAVAYCDALRDVYLAQDSGVCTCGDRLGHETATPKTPRLKAVRRPKLPRRGRTERQMPTLETRLDVHVSPSTSRVACRV